MNFIFSLFGKLLVRRVAYFVGPFLVGLAASNWWVQDLFHSWDFDPANMEALTAGLLALGGVIIASINEYVAWKRDRIAKNKSATFSDLVIDLHLSGKLEEFCGKAEEKVKPAIKAVLDDYAKRQEKLRALNAVSKTTTVLLLVTCLATPCRAAEIIAVDSPSALMPAPQMTINTNTMLALSKAWQSDISTPQLFFGAVKDNLNLFGVYSWTLDGASGAGVAGQLVIGELSFEAMKFELGPALVLGTDSESDLFQMVQLGATMKLIGEKFQAVWETVPMLSFFPIEWGGFYGYVGVGVVVDGIRSWEPIGFGCSVGGGGIRWGKKK